MNPMPPYYGTRIWRGKRWLHWNIQIRHANFFRVHAALNHSITIFTPKHRIEVALKPYTRRFPPTVYVSGNGMHEVGR